MSDNKNVLIEVRDLCKSFDHVKVLNGISTTISQGEVVAIIGPSGCGKSTFLRSMNLLEKPTSGSILFEGTDITDSSVDINKMRQKIGMVFQQFNLFPNHTVKGNIMLAPVQTGLMTKEEASKRADELLVRVGLSDKADVYPAMLSGGQKQRIAIARADVYKRQSLTFAETASFSATFKTGNIHLGRWLRKWEMMRTEFYFCFFSKQLLYKLGQCSL